MGEFARLFGRSRRHRGGVIFVSLDFIIVLVEKTQRCVTSIGGQSITSAS
jgi:hypothetical protein